MPKLFKPRGRDKYCFFYTDKTGRRRKKTCTTDKTVSERVQRDVLNKVALRKEGLIDPKDEAYRRHEGRPLTDHLEDFHRGLLARGDTTKHADLFVGRARRVADLAGIGRLSDLSPSRIQGALADLRAEGLALGTLNHYRNAIRALSRWLWKDGRLRDDPLVGVAGFNAREDRRHDRRTLGLEELRRLIAVTHGGVTHHGMSGLARALCYRLAVASGLRYAEIGSVTPESFDWGERPAVMIQAGYAKDGATARLPLPADVVADLVEWVREIPPGSPVFSLPLERGASMLRRDLEAAGIPYRDDAGLVFDFHSLRCQMATLADQAGCSPRVVQRLMRHSTLELTGRYTRPRLVDLEAASRSIPSLRPVPPPTAARGSATAGATHEDLDGSNPLSRQELASATRRKHDPQEGGSGRPTRDVA